MIRQAPRMKITFLINHDLPSLLALNYLIPALAQDEFSVFYTNRPVSRIASNTSELFELNEFDQNKLAQFSSLKQPLYSFAHFKAKLLNDINVADFARYIESQPDLVISIRHMSILGQAVIDYPRHGIINLHSGLLPEYKGVMATFWALLNKESQVGTTLHYIEDSTIDTGSIISRSISNVDYRQSYFWNVLNLYRAGSVNILDAVRTLKTGCSLISKNQASNGRYYTYPTANDIKKIDVPLFNLSDSPLEFI